MKRKKIIFVLLFTCFIFAGCGNTAKTTSNVDEKENMQVSGSGAAIKEVKKDTSSKKDLNAFANRQVKEQEVSYSCEVGSISLNIPEGWSYKISKYKKTKKNQTFGISFWPDETKKYKITVRYTKLFGVCGTGLEIKEINLNGMKAEAGYYDGKSYWDYILFLDEEYKEYDIWNECSSEKWWKKYGSQVMEILHTLKLGARD